MIEKKLIVGVDPGTTTGLAILDSKGNLLKLKAKKYFLRSEIIKEIFKCGKPIIITTDRSSCPSSIREIAAKLDSKLFLPEKDLRRKKKRNLVSKYEKRIESEHEKDALAAALYAFKQLKDLFRRIKHRFSKERKIREVKEKIILGKAKNIEEALDED